MKNTLVPSGQSAVQVKPQKSIPQDPVMGNVRSIEFKGLSGQGLTSLELLDIQVELTQVGDAYRAVQKGQPVSTIRLADITSAGDGSGYLLHASAMKAMLDGVSRTYQKHKIAGVRVNITRRAIERLRAQKSDGVLVIDILEGRVAKIRALPAGVESQSKALSAKVKESGIGNNRGTSKSNEPRFIKIKSDNSEVAGDSGFAKGNESAVDPGNIGNVVGDEARDPLCERIRELSAVQPGELIRLDVLDRYVAYLNRHPGRQVDVALAPGPEDGELTLDYLLSEIRQPMFYAQVSNTGTEQTSRCREQFGFIHNNLTRKDDILYLDYITGSFDSVHGLSGGYERPLGDWVTGDDVSKRKDYNGWNWGDWTRVRAKVYGSWREYEAAEVGLVNQEFSGKNYSVGGELVWNVFQHSTFFVDLLAGLQHHRVKTKNDLAGTEGKSSFLLPYFGLRAEKQTEKVNFNGSLIAEFNLPDFGGTDKEGLMSLDKLGRVNTDREWLTLRYMSNASFFLEPLFDKKWKKPDHHSTLAHELFTSVRGQFTPGDDRVPANYMQTMGGFYTVRGYPESFATGDSAFMGTLEYRFHLPRSLKPEEEPVKIFSKSFRLRPEYELGRPDWDLIFRGFFDFGYTHKNDKLDFEDNSTLFSSGLGVELMLRNNMKIRTDWGLPLKAADNGEDDVSVGDGRLHMSLSVIF